MTDEQDGAEDTRTPYLNDVLADLAVIEAELQDNRPLAALKYTREAKERLQEEMDD